MSRRILVFALVTLFFLAGIGLAVLPLCAEILAGRGDYAAAIRLDPLNADWHAAAGRKHIEDAKASRDGRSWQSAKAAFEKAIGLNPTTASHYLGWAEAAAALLSARGVVPAAEIDAYVANLRKAVECDPNYYFTNAAAGYSILLFRNRITGVDRNFALYRLRYALELNPRYRNEIFSSVVNGLDDYTILRRITPRTEWWQGQLFAFLRNVDKWKYRQR